MSESDALVACQDIVAAEETLGVLRVLLPFFALFESLSGVIFDGGVYQVYRHPDLNHLDGRIGEIHLVDEGVVAKSADVFEGLSKAIQVKGSTAAGEIPHLDDVVEKEVGREVGFGIAFGREQERVNIVPAVHPASVNFKRDLVTPVHGRAAATVGFEEQIPLQPQ